MANYVTSFVVPVPKKKLKAYQAMAKTMGKIWMKHGALVHGVRRRRRGAGGGHPSPDKQQ